MFDNPQLVTAALLLVYSLCSLIFNRALSLSAFFNLFFCAPFWFSIVVFSVCWTIRKLRDTRLSRLSRTFHIDTTRTRQPTAILTTSAQPVERDITSARTPPTRHAFEHV